MGTTSEDSALTLSAYQMLFANGTSAVVEAEDRLHAHVRGQFVALRNNTLLVGTSMYTEQKEAQ